jgi:hypothetical protein
MEQVVGEYRSLASAQRAVREVERCGISIQNVFISDEQTRVWRKLHAPWARRAPLMKRLQAALASLTAGPRRYLNAGKRTEPFLVVFRGTTEQVRNLRRLLTH